MDENLRTLGIDREAINNLNAIFKEQHFESNDDEETRLTVKPKDFIESGNVGNYALYIYEIWKCCPKLISLLNR